MIFKNSKNPYVLVYLKFALIIIPLLIIISCNKNEPELPVSDEEFEFELLVLEKDTIKGGETSTIEAIAKGVDLTYNWSASIGDVLGSGSKVIYGASPCAVGNVLIKCEVKDAYENSSEKTVKLFIR